MSKDLPGQNTACCCFRMPGSPRADVPGFETIRFQGRKGLDSSLEIWYGPLLTGRGLGPYLPRILITTGYGPQYGAHAASVSRPGFADGSKGRKCFACAYCEVGLAILGYGREVSHRHFEAQNLPTPSLGYLLAPLVLHRRSGSYLRRTEVRRMPQCSFGILDTRQDFSKTAPSHRRMTR